MLLVHLLAGLLFGLIAGLWGWVAGLPVLAAVSLYVFGGSLGIAASAAVVFLLSRQASAARKAEGTARMFQSQQECYKCGDGAIRVSAPEQRPETLRQDSSGR